MADNPQIFDIPIGNVKGPPGNTGNGISSIALLQTVGLDKTYRITMTDETHYDFTVTDGNGISGVAFNPETYTLTLTFDDGTSYTTGSLRGAPGAPGNDGISPAVTITTITGGHRVTITDADHPQGQTFDVMDGNGNVTSVAGKTGAVTLDGNDISFDQEDDYDDGTVGKALKDELNAIDEIDNTVFTEINLIDTSNYIESKTSYAPTNNGDGTWTFRTNDYGTTTWQSIDIVPAGKYILQGSPYGYTFVTTSSLYSGVIKTNRTGSDVEFENSSSQVLYIGIRTDARPPEEFVFYPHINGKESNVITKNQGAENVGKVLMVGQDGNLTPDDFTIDVDNTLTQQGEPADAKAAGDRLTSLESMVQPVVHTIHHTIQVSGTSGGNVEANIGVLIPRGSNATITASTDIMYRGDSIQVWYNSKPLMTYLRQTFSGHALYDASVTVDVPDGDSFIQTIRVGLTNIENTSGVIDITVTFTTGENLVGMENILSYKAGENLINPDLVYNHVEMNATVGYIMRATSDTSVCWVPIVAGGTVTFNKVIPKMAIVDKVFEGTFNIAELVSGKKITNSQDADTYVLFNVETSVFADLIAVNGEYPADYKPYNIIGGYVENTLDRTYGTISMYYPDEGENVKRIDSNQNPNRLRFVHISDTHQGSNNPIGRMGEFTDLSAAKFLTITGDLVNNTIDDDITITNSQILAMGKPCYICMGNHDVWNDTSPTQRYTKYFNPIAEHNGVSEDVSYYAVDFSTEHVKCIWLDIYELSTGTPSFEMSSTQINWFFSQLDDAIANNYHVCAFLHQPLTAINEPINTFFDYSLLSAPESVLKWILDTVNAFQNAGTIEFEHNGNSFSHAFAGNGVFVAYFNGHTHYDSVGWLKNYNQFNVTINRFTTSGESYDMVYRNEKLNIVANYVAIDTYARRLSVVRIGNNNTIAGIKRDAFTVIY